MLTTEPNTTNTLSVPFDIELEEEQNGGDEKNGGQVSAGRRPSATAGAVVHHEHHHHPHPHPHHHRHPTTNRARRITMVAKAILTEKMDNDDDDVGVDLDIADYDEVIAATTTRQRREGNNNKRKQKQQQVSFEAFHSSILNTVGLQGFLLVLALVDLCLQCAVFGLGGHKNTGLCLTITIIAVLFQLELICRMCVLRWTGYWDPPRKATRNFNRWELVSLSTTTVFELVVYNISTSGHVTLFYVLRVVCLVLRTPTVLRRRLNLMRGVVRFIVSADRRRYILDGFDLDITYITPTMIAMSYPSSALEAFYRNNITSVAEFLEYKHGGGGGGGGRGGYHVYNMCSERSYDGEAFFGEGNCTRYLLEDHNPACLDVALSFCKKVVRDERTKNTVAAVHCKGGKGRTGFMICCYLLYTGQASDAEDAMARFGSTRTSASARKFQGVESPSQARFVRYFAQMVADRREGKKGIDNEISIPDAPPCRITRVSVRGLRETQIQKLWFAVVQDPYHDGSGDAGEIETSNKTTTTSKVTTATPDVFAVSRASLSHVLRPRLALKGAKKEKSSGSNNNSSSSCCNADATLLLSPSSFASFSSSSMAPLSPSAASTTTSTTNNNTFSATGSMSILNNNNNIDWENQTDLDEMRVDSHNDNNDNNNVFDVTYDGAFAHRTFKGNVRLMLFGGGQVSPLLSENIAQVWFHTSFHYPGLAEEGNNNNNNNNNSDAVVVHLSFPKNEIDGPHKDNNNNNKQKKKVSCFHDDLCFEVELTYD
eukprot:PhM_4_TR3370/c1_g1_i1/m.20670/K18079/TPTE, TPIP; PTEN homologous phosphatase